MSSNDMKDEGDSTAASYMLQDFMNSQYGAHFSEDTYRVDNWSEKNNTYNTVSQKILDDYESNDAYVQSSVLWY